MFEFFPDTTPDVHRGFLTNLVSVVSGDSRIVGLAAGGSFTTDSMDEFSDLDLVVAVEPSEFLRVLEDRKTIAASFGHLLTAFTGEHVGEPRLLICLYDQPLLHVDLKFVTLEDAAVRVEDPIVTWQRDQRLSRSLQQGNPKYPMPDPEWIEDRFWVWVHYAAVKIGRGELFEVLGFLAFLREKVLGPLAVLQVGERPAGVRRFETTAPQFVQSLQKTVASHDTADCFRALLACVELYRSLRPFDRPEGEGGVEQVVMAYVGEMAKST